MLLTLPGILNNLIVINVVEIDREPDFDRGPHPLLGRGGKIGAET